MMTKTANLQSPRPQSQSGPHPNHGAGRTGATGSTSCDSKAGSQPDSDGLGRAFRKMGDIKNFNQEEGE